MRKWLNLSQTCLCYWDVRSVAFRFSHTIAWAIDLYVWCEWCMSSPPAIIGPALLIPSKGSLPELDHVLDSLFIIELISFIANILITCLYYWQPIYVYSWIHLCCTVYKILVMLIHYIDWLSAQTNIMCHALSGWRYYWGPWYFLCKWLRGNLCCVYIKLCIYY